MDCQIRRSDDFIEMILVGSLDSSWASYLSDRFDEVVRGGALDVRVDMSGVSYLSSSGIALLVRYHQQLRGIGGRFRIVADSEAVSHVLRLTGVTQLLHDLAEPGADETSLVSPVDVVERHGMTLQLFPAPVDRTAERLDLFGDPSRLPGRGYAKSDERTWRATPDAAAIGLGALGPSFEACRGRFGEFLAVGGVAAYRPGGGPSRPDFEHAAGSFVPVVRILHGLSFRVDRASVIRFEARGEPGSAVTPLSRIVAACVEQSGGGPTGIVVAGECDGLVGAALRKSPVDLPDWVDPFAQPEARDWLSFTPEPEHARSTAIIVGVAAREADATLAPFVRPLTSASDLGLMGHFHAAVVPYRPLPGGALELTATLSSLFGPGRIETILHLISDARPIVGAGESTLTRGVIWHVSLTVPQGTTPS